jgi:hypothetical protein
MITDAHNFLIYVALVAVAAIIGHVCVRRFWLTCGIVAIGCSVLNIACEIVAHDFHIRPSDVALWLPMLLAYGAAIAFQIALLIGLPFYFCRCTRKPGC